MRPFEKNMLLVLLFLLGMGVQGIPGPLPPDNNESSVSSSFESQKDYNNVEVERGIETGANYDNSEMETEWSAGVTGEYYYDSDPIVEMLIAVSQEFANHFNNDNSAMITYFNALFLDVDHRFKTLAGTNIAFQVKSIEIFEDQYVLADAVMAEGTVDMEKVLDNFAKWAYKRKENFPNFDMAMLVIFPEIDCCSRLGMAYLRGVCNLGDEENGKVSSSFVVTLRGNESPAAVVAHEIAHVLGANHDNETGRVDSEAICTSDFTLFNIMNPFTVDDDTYSFSHCSAEDAAEFINSEQGECLRWTDTSIAPIIDTSTSGAAEEDIIIPPGVSVTTQCRLLDHMSTAVTKPPHENQCGYIDACMKLNDFGNGTTLLNLHLLDGTPCGASGRCFRGECFPVGVQLVSVEYGHCLTSQDRFASDEWPIMGTCSRPVTPPRDMLIVGESGMFGRHLMTPFIVQGIREIGLKCLTLYIGSNPFVYLENCSNEKTSPWFGWEFANFENGEFQVHHYRAKEFCLRVSNDSQEVTVSTNCSIFDEETRFTLLSENGTIIRNGPLAIGSGNFDEGLHSQDNSIELWGYVVCFLTGCSLTCILGGVMLGLPWKTIIKICKHLNTRMAIMSRDMMAR